jgi:hypothetical protein
MAAGESEVGDGAFGPASARMPIMVAAIAGGSAPATTGPFGRPRQGPGRRKGEEGAFPLAPPRSLPAGGQAAGDCSGAITGQKEMV